MNGTNNDAVTAARTAYAAFVAKHPSCTARKAFNAARTAALAFTTDRKAADRIADEAMQAETNGNITLNCIRWSEFSGGVGA